MSADTTDLCERLGDAAIEQDDHDKLLARYFREARDALTAQSSVIDALRKERDGLTKAWRDLQVFSHNRINGLLTELDALRGEVAGLQAAYDKLTGEQFSDRVHVALRAKLADVTKDALRYRWLRDTPWDEDIYRIITLHMNASWDAAIDTRLAALQPRAPYTGEEVLRGERESAPDVTSAVIDSPQPSLEREV